VGSGHDGADGADGADGNCFSFLKLLLDHKQSIPNINTNTHTLNKSSKLKTLNECEYIL